MSAFFSGGRAVTAPSVLRISERGRVSRDLKATEAFVVELLNKREVSDETFAKARTALGEHKLVNLIAFMGYANVRCAQKALAGIECSF